MKRRANNLLDPRIGFFAVLVLVAGCGGGGGTTPPPPPPVAPSIATQPASQTVPVGQAATFTVVATGTSPLNYQWQKNGAAISGATSSTYTTPATTVADNGSQFTVVVSNAAGSVTSASATLRVTRVTSVTVSCVPTTVLVNQTSQCSAAVQGTGNFSSAVTWSANVGTVSASGLFTAPASVGTATITAKSVQDPTKSGTANVTVNLQPLSVSVSPATATVVLGSGQNLTASANDPAATFTWSLAGPGSLSSASGATIAYQANANCSPSAWFATATVTATSGAQTATATVQLTLEYPVPTVTSISPRNIFSVREAIIPVVVTGSGFCIGGSFNLVGTDMSAGATNLSFNQFTLFLGFDSAHFAPGAYGLTVSSPTDGHGGGTSTAFRFSFVGNQNTVAFSATQLFSLEQGAGKIHVFDLATLAFVRDINVGRLVYAIAVGDGFLYTTQSNGVGLHVIGNPIVFPSIPAINLPMGVAEKNGWLCPARDQNNLLACVDITQANPTVTTVAIGTTPMEVAMTTTASGQLSAVVLNAGDGTIAVVQVPLPAQGQVIPSVHLPGMTTTVSGEQTGTRGGTQLVVLEYTNQTTPVRIAAVLGRFDKSIWFVDVGNPSQAMSITGPFSVSGDPYRLAVDTANKVFVFALADYAADGSAITRFVRIDPTSGAATTLSSTVPFIASGVAVNPVSGQIIACGGANCVQAPNN